MPKTNRQVGAMKRQIKKPGDLISKVNESKEIIRNKNKPEFSKTRLEIMGLV